MVPLFTYTHTKQLTLISCSMVFFVVSCGGMNMPGPYGVVPLGGMALWKDICHHVCRLSDLLPSCLEASLLLAAFRSKCRPLSSPAQCLPGHCHVSALMITGRTSEPVRYLQLNAVLYKSCLDYGVYSQQ